MKRRGTDVDLLVHGSGMVGLSLCVAAADAGFSVALVDAREVVPWEGGEPDLRVSAVTRASQRILERLSAWEWVAARRAGAVEAIEAQDGLSDAVVTFSAADIGEPCLAHIVENRLIQTALLERLRRMSGVRTYVPASVERLDAEPDAVAVRLDDGRSLRVGLVAAADGAGSKVRELAGIRVHERDYGQKGLVCTVATELPHDRVARQRFLPGGPVAFLPLPDGRCSLVWSQPVDEADERLALSEAAFCEALSAASGRMLGTITGCGERAAFPLRRQHAERYVADRLALVGDAAHVIHPLAGQGANLGFLDAAALVAVMARARERGHDPGGPGALRRYERWRKGDNLLMQNAMDVFHWLFGRQDALSVGLRSLGLGVTDRLAPAKQLFMAHAMGERLDLPPLGRR